MEFDISLVSNSLPLLLRGALTSRSDHRALGRLRPDPGAYSRSFPAREDPRCFAGPRRSTSTSSAAPLLIQIFIIYFALPNLIGHRIDPFIAAVTACSLNSGAYIAGNLPAAFSRSRRVRCAPGSRSA